MKSLQSMVVTVEANNSRPVDIWLVVPGGLILGRIANSDDYAEAIIAALNKHAPAESPGDAANIARNAKEMIAKGDEAMEPPTSQEVWNMAFLIDVTIISGGQYFHAPTADVAINRVSAWGLGVLATPKA